MTQYEKENEALLQDILEDSFYKGFREPALARQVDNSLELNITASCNQKCEYCYLAKYGDEIYPVELRDPNKITENLKLLIAYFLKNEMHPRYIDIFSGEIWGSALADECFSIILTAIKTGWKIESIMVPSNMSFLLSEKKTKNIKSWIEAYKQIGCRLSFSASVDGYMLEAEQRSFINEEQNKSRTMEFYDKLFTWCKKYAFAFHPMVAAYGIEKWVDNYKWWQDMFTKYELNPFEYGMYLEVRNNDWTVEKIGYYLDFVNYMIDHTFNTLMNGDMEQFALDVVHPLNDRNRGYFPYVLVNDGNTYNCTINTALIVRLGDLAIGPCHRTHYDKFIYGRYRVEDGEIVGLDANNIQMANLILNQTNKGLMKCNKCPISYHCMRGCLGSQYENTGEILQPCESVCWLLKARIIFLYFKYKKMGVFDYIYASGKSNKISFLKNLEDDLLLLKEGEPNLWKYWETVIKQKIQ